MARIVGIHELELRPGVSEAELEEAVKTLLAQPAYPGWHLSLLKGNRGDRVGKYGLLFEIESIEARDHIINDDGDTEAGKEFDAKHPELMRAYEHFMSLAVQPSPWTDYHEILSSK